MARRSFNSLPVRTDSAKGHKSDALSGRIPPVCAQIRHFRECMGIEQKELAGKIGVTGNAVSNWENGRSRPDIHLLPALCSVLNVTLYELFDLPDPAQSLSENEQQHLTSYRMLSEGHRRAVNVLTDTLLSEEQKQNTAPAVRTLLFFDKPLAAGIGDPSEFEEHTVPFHVYEDRVKTRADFVFAVSGDSMEPSYHDGDLVYVERASAVSDGETGAFISGNECYLKVYHHDGLYSLNPAYPPMHFSANDSVYLIGRVLGKVQKEDIVIKEEVPLRSTLRG